MKEQIAPINPFDSPPHDYGMNELSETSIRLEDMFQNEAFGGVNHNNSDDIPIQQHTNTTNHDKVIINNDIMVDVYVDDIYDGLFVGNRNSIYYSIECCYLLSFVHHYHL